MRSADRDPKISLRSRGAHDAREWLTEGDGLLISARVMRASWLLKRRHFPKKMEGPFARASLWAELTGLPRASMLLLGYSIEMFLKAGLVKAYVGCRTGMFDRDSRRFGHDLVRIAQRIYFPLRNGDHDNFLDLNHLIVDGARYPITPKDTIEYTSALNRRTFSIWDRRKFSNLCDLAKRIRSHVSNIDEDSSNPSSQSSYDIELDGYLAFRMGGNLPPQITYRPSTSMIEAGQGGLEDIRRIFARHEFSIVNLYWSQCAIYLDRDRSTEVVFDPSHECAIRSSRPRKVR